VPRVLRQDAAFRGYPCLSRARLSFLSSNQIYPAGTKAASSDSITGGLDDGVDVSNQALRWRAAWARKQCFTQAHGILARQEDRQVYGGIVGCHRGRTSLGRRALLQPRCASRWHAGSRGNRKSQPPGGTPWRRGAMRKTSSTVQLRQGRGLTATSAMRTTALAPTEWAARPIRAGRAAPAGWRRRLYARPCCV
jgi:hypothetical protein